MAISDLDYTDDSDVALILRTRTGDMDAYGLLHERHAGPAKAVAWRMSRSPSDADDLVSEGFARVLAAIQRGSGPETSFRPYLLSTIRRLAYDRSKRERRETTVDWDLDGGTPPSDPILEGFERDTASAAFASLPERWQTVLWHTEVEGDPPAKVALLLGISPNAVAALAYRAREGLRQAYLANHASGGDHRECRHIEDRLAAYVRDGLTDAQRQRVADHLAWCEGCADAHRELLAVNTSLRSVLALAVLGPAATAYLDAPAPASTAARPAGRGRPLRRLRHVATHSGRAALVATAGAAVVGALVVGGWQRSDAPSTALGGPAPSTTVAPTRVLGSSTDQAPTTEPAPTTTLPAGVTPSAPPTPPSRVPALPGPAGRIRPVVGGGGGSIPAAVPAQPVVGGGRSIPAAVPAQPVAPAPHGPTDPAEPAPTTPVTPTAPASSAPSVPTSAAPAPGSTTTTTTRPGSPGSPVAPPPLPGVTWPGRTPTTASTVPETTVPETTVPETTIPETTVPETTIPETTVPETTVPETTVPPAEPEVDAVLTSAGRLVAGRPGVVVLTLTNQGDTATGPLDVDLDLGSLVPRAGASTAAGIAGWSCTATPIRCSTAPLEPGTSRTLHLPVRVPPATGPIHVTATVRSAGTAAETAPLATADTDLVVGAGGVAVRYATVAPGQIATAGNGLLTCPDGSTGCADARRGTGSRPDNGDHRMIPADVDDDPTTANSSSATLACGGPATLDATLYWGARLDAGRNGSAAPQPGSLGQVMVRPPGAGAGPVEAERVDQVGYWYQGVADVTDLVRASGPGRWTVGGVQASTGEDTFAGWTLVVVCADPGAPVRSLTVLDGLSKVSAGSTTSFGLDGFVVPARADARATLAVTAYEGDLGLTGDQLTVGSTPVADALNQIGNTFNATTSDLGAAVGGADPDVVNHLGFDLDRFDITGALGAGSTTSSVTLSTQQDVYAVGMVAVSIDQ